MVYFVKGRAGTGKTKYLHDLFHSLAKSGNDKLLFIVPDNATFETANAFIEEMGRKALSYVKIYGFTTLSDYILEQTGNKHLSFADDGIKHVVMNMAINEVSSELDVFKNRAKSKDLCDVMLDTMNDFKLRTISGNALTDISRKVADKRLTSKLVETGLIFNKYDEIISKSYIDPSDKLKTATEALLNSDLFEGYTIAIDSHKAFSKLQLEMIKALIEKSENIYFSICEDENSSSIDNLFYTNYVMEQRIKTIANDINVKVEECNFESVEKRFCNSALKAIERNIFTIDKTPYSETNDDVILYTAQSIYDESDFVSREIKKLIEAGYRYKDIAVISRHPEKYNNILDMYFKKYGISYFISKPENIDSKPLIKFVTTVFDIVNDYFNKDDILALLKTGLTSYSFDDIALFENYVFTWNVNRRDFFSEFTMNPRGFADEFLDEDKEELKVVEAIRADLISKLQKFDSSCNKATGKDISYALMDLLYDLEVDKNINTLVTKLENEQIHSGEELCRTWNLLVDILDKLVYVTKEYQFSKRRYGELLHTYISNSDIAYIPTGIDQVTLYDATTVSFNEKEAVFVIGCNDTEFPNSVSDKGLFSFAECKVLSALHFDIADNIEEIISQENMYAYVALTRATNKLYVSHYKQELSGDVVSKSTIFSEILTACPNVKQFSFEDVDIYDHLWCDNSAFEYFTENYLNKDVDTESLEYYFLKDDNFKATIDAIRNNKDKTPKQIEDLELASKLFGKELNLSASKVDKFYLCKFKYFIEYGLKINERRKATIDSLEYGTLMHYVLESFLSNHSKNDYAMLSDEDVETEVNKILDTYAYLHLGGLEDKTARFLYLFKRMKKTAIALILHLSKELSQSDFVPTDFELNIGNDIPKYTLKVSDDINISLYGSVDRVDIYEDNNDKYIRIIDYKTGTKKFSLSDILYGINLQMLIYLFAIEKNGKEKYGDITPAGILYVPAKDPKVSPDIGASEDKIEKDKNKEMKMHGVVLDNTKIINAMDKTDSGTFIPVRLTKDGNINGGDKNNVATLEEFGLLSKKVDSLLCQMASELLSGDIKDNPAKGRYDACEWCKFKSICGHTDTDPHRTIKTVSKEQVYAELRGGDNNA